MDAEDGQREEASGGGLQTGVAGASLSFLLKLVVSPAM